MTSSCAQLKSLRARYKDGLVPDFYTQLLPHKHIPSTMFSVLRAAVVNGLMLTYEMVVEGFSVDAGDEFDTGRWRAEALQLAYHHKFFAVDVHVHFAPLSPYCRDKLLGYVYRNCGIVPNFEAHMKHFEEIGTLDFESDALVSAYSLRLLEHFPRAL